jgi:hypothetical protein
MTSKKNEKTVTEVVDLATVAPAGALANAEDFSDFEGDEDKRTKDEVVLERLRIVQSMTKDKQKNGLQDGQLYGNMTRKGFDRLLIVPLYDYRTVVERTSDKKGTFVKEYLETADGSGDFGDLKVQNAIAAAGGLKGLRNAADGNQLALTYNCFVAILDPSNGTTIKGCGLLQADKTNIRPYLLWRQNRVDFDGAVNVPVYCFRTFVDGKGTYTNPEGQTTQQYQFQPYVENNWKDSLLVPSKHREVMLKLRDQRKLMQSGAIKVAEHESEGVSEDAQEEAAF